jgi:chromosomal replication initiator protein
MIEHNQAVALWNRCLSFIKDNVNATAFKTWFEPIVPLKYEATEKALTWVALLMPNTSSS